MVRLFGPAGKGLMLFNSYPFIFLFLPIVLLCDMVNSRRTAWFIIFFAIAVMLVVAAVAVPRRRKRIIAVGLVAALAAMVYLPVFWSKNGTLAQPARARWNRLP